MLQLSRDGFRSKMTLVFTSGKLKSLFQLMQESGEKRDHLHDQIKDNSKIVSIKVKDTFYKYITDVISSVAFGQTALIHRHQNFMSTVSKIINISNEFKHAIHYISLFFVYIELFLQLYLYSISLCST